MGVAADVRTARSAQIVASMVATLLPRWPDLDDPTRSAVRADVTEFVTGQVEALPTFMKLPYKSALIAFDSLAILRYGRRFQALRSAQQSTYLAQWSANRFAAARDLIKLIRSCTLLAYFDDPRISVALGVAPARTTAALR